MRDNGSLHDEILRSSHLFQSEMHLSIWVQIRWSFSMSVRYGWISLSSADQLWWEKWFWRGFSDAHLNENLGVRSLGEDCQWSNQCRRIPIETTKVCFEQRCQCASGYIPIDTFRCIRDFGQFIRPSRLLDWRNWDCLAQITAQIRVTKASGVEPAGFGSTCSTTEECQHETKQLECSNGTCLCIEGHVPLGKQLCYDTRGHGNWLRERRNRSRWWCVSFSGFTAIPSATSSRTSTTLEPVNNVVIKSLGKIGNSCTNDYFCRRTIPESHCYNGKCACLEGLIAVDQYTCAKSKCVSRFFDGIENTTNTTRSQWKNIVHLHTSTRGLQEFTGWTVLNEP